MDKTGLVPVDEVQSGTHLSLLILSREVVPLFFICISLFQDVSCLTVLSVYEMAGVRRTPSSEYLQSVSRTIGICTTSVRDFSSRIRENLLQKFTLFL
jgi:hypothetical protein